MFYLIPLALMLGVAFRSFFDVGVYDIAFLLLVMLTTAVVGVLYAKKHRKNILTWLVCMLLLLIALVRSDVVFERKPHPQLRESMGQEVVLRGYVSDEPVVRESGRNVVVAVEEVKGETLYGHGRKVLVHGNFYPELFYGDEVIVTGELMPVENFQTETGRVFVYTKFLAKDGIYTRIFRPEIEVVGERRGSAVKRALFSLKHSFVSVFGDVIPEPHSSLLGGITVGAEDSLGESLEKRFRDTGIIHIVVLSGYNVTIVAEFFMSLLSWAPFVASSLVGGVSVVLFAILTGASATIVRASIMALFVIVARLSARRYDITRALFIAGAAMVLHNPYILLYDPGFQLSFLATFGLIYLAPLVEARLGWLPSRFQMREFATATIATQIFVLPLLLYMTGTLSLVAVPVNLLILPVVPLAMFGGLVTGVSGFLSKALAFIPALPTFALLEWMLRIVDFFARLPFATVPVPTVPLWVVLATYTGFAIWLWKRLRPRGVIQSDLATLSPSSGKQKSPTA